MCDCNVPTSQEVKKTKQNPSQKQEEVSEEYDKKKVLKEGEELEQTLIAGKRLTLRCPTMQVIEDVHLNIFEFSVNGLLFILLLDCSSFSNLEGLYKLRN